jgi:hypothetical protein
VTGHGIDPDHARIWNRSGVGFDAVRRYDLVPPIPDEKCFCPYGPQRSEYVAAKAWSVCQ